jgi:DNA-binding NtrC family response regulator
MPAPPQAGLTLDDGQYSKVAQQPLAAEARVIAATNRQLPERTPTPVSAGSYHRLQAIEIYSRFASRERSNALAGFLQDFMDRPAAPI